MSASSSGWGFQSPTGCPVATALIAERATSTLISRCHPTSRRYSKCVTLPVTIGRVLLMAIAAIIASGSPMTRPRASRSDTVDDEGGDRLRLDGGGQPVVGDHDIRQTFEALVRRCPVDGSLNA